MAEKETQFVTTGETITFEQLTERRDRALLLGRHAAWLEMLEENDLNID